MRYSGFSLVVGAILIVTLFAPIAAASAPAVSDASQVLMPVPVAGNEYMKRIQVNDLMFDPLAETPKIPAALRFGSAVTDGANYYIVQFNAPIKKTMVSSLESTGAHILYYVNYNAFVVHASADSIKLAKHLPNVRWTGVFEPAYKISPALSERYEEMLRQVQGVSAGAGSASGSFSYSSSILDKSIPASSVADMSSFGAGAGASTSAQEPDPVIQIELVTFEKSSVQLVARQVIELGGTAVSICDGSSGLVRATIDRGLIPAVARCPDVMWIDRQYQYTVYNDIARWVVQSGDTYGYSTPIHDHGIFGTGQIVTVGDSGLAYRESAFYDPDHPTPGADNRKVTAYYTPAGGYGDAMDNGINHGTHVSGSIAGDDGVWHVYDGNPLGSNGTIGPHDGQAFNATIEMQDMSSDGYGINPPTDFHVMFQEALNRGSYIHTNSWGSYGDMYTEESQATDDFIWDNRDFIVLFAAANGGSYLYSMSNQANSKNVIAVGATENGQGLERVADFSSRGPTNDSRIKPDVMAPGVEIWSVRGDDPGTPLNQYWQLSGTSMATPTVAGSTALVREYYMSGWYPTGTPQPANGFVPSAALVKATLINSAREMTDETAYANGEHYYPNDNQGWGRITLDDALQFKGDARGLVVQDERIGLDTGQSSVYQLAIGDSSMPVEMTLVWTDYPAAPYSSPNLVNDLDMVITAPDGTVYRGNQFAGYNPGSSVPNPTGRDHVNNVEGVLVYNPPVGLWTVNVIGFDVPYGPQPFALVMTGGVATQTGQVQMDKGHYKSDATVNITVVDTGLNLDPNASDEASVTIWSSTEAVAEDVTLTETGDATCVFRGSMMLQDSSSPVHGDGKLQVRDRDNITVSYFDANNGFNGSGYVHAYAVVDDRPPIIMDVNVTSIRFSRATVTWTTDEPSDSLLRYGDAVPPTSLKAETLRSLSHSLPLKGLVENTTYYFSVQSEDEAGNIALDDNSGTYFQFTTPLRPPVAPANTEWPMYQNNPSREGVSPGQFTPPLRQMWTQGPYFEALWTSPILSDGILYTTYLDGYIRAMDPYSGALLWQRMLGSTYYYVSTPAAADGIVYVSFTTDNYTGLSGYGLYALDGQTGETIWFLDDSSGLQFNARTALIYADGMLFGSSWDNHLYAINVSDGSVRWSYYAQDLPLFGGALGMGLVGFTLFNQMMVAVDEFTGEQVWSTTLDSVAIGPPLFAQGCFYVGTIGGTMYCLDAFSGEVVWMTSGFYSIEYGTPAYDGSSIYFGTYGSGDFVSLDASDGSILWMTSSGGYISSSVTYANGFVYGTSTDEVLYVLDALSGAILYKYPLQQASLSSLAVSEGWVWAQDEAGEVYGFMGQLPVGLVVSPPTNHSSAAPPDTVDYSVTVTNVGTSGADTFDVTAAEGSNGWSVGLYDSSGSAPLADTDGDGIPDTGLLPTNASATLTVRITVPASGVVGDEERSVITLVSSNDVNVSRSAEVITTVPPPGVEVGPRGYLQPMPGEIVKANLTITNTGGFPDTIEVMAGTDKEWPVALFYSDGVTPLEDTDSDWTQDTGPLQGLQSIQIVAEVQVPSDTPLGSIDRLVVYVWSNEDPGATDMTTVVFEIATLTSNEWPTYRQNNARTGVSQMPFELPLRPYWTSPTQDSYAISWFGPTIADNMVFSTDWAGRIKANDVKDGTLIWQKGYGTNGQSGAPAVAYGNVYTIFEIWDYYNYTYRAVMFCLDEQTGQVVWESNGNGNYGSGFTAPAVALGMVFWADQSGGWVYADDAFSGARIWDYPLTGYSAVYGGPTYWAGELIFADTSGVVTALDAYTGDLLWTNQYNSPFYGGVTISRGVAYVSEAYGYIHAFDPLTGDSIWDSQNLGGYMYMQTPIEANGLVMVCTNQQNYNYTQAVLVSGLDAETGEQVWSTELAPLTYLEVSPSYGNGALFIPCDDGYLYVVEAASGSIVQRLPFNQYYRGTSAAIADGLVVMGDDSGTLTAFAFAGLGELRYLELNPLNATVGVTGSVRFHAEAFDLYGYGLDLPLDWSTTAGLGVVVPSGADSGTGVFIAGPVAGSDTVVVRGGNTSATATIEVVAGVPTEVTVTPFESAVPVGGLWQFTAVVTDRWGNQIHGAAVSWNVSAGLGTINSTGVLIASTTVTTGFVTAIFGGETGTAAVEIVPGVMTQVSVDPTALTDVVRSLSIVHARGFDAYGNEIPGLVFEWSADIGTISPATDSGDHAMFTAGAAVGTGTITVTCLGLNGTVYVTVTPDQLATLAILNPYPTVVAGGSLSLAAVGWDAFGNPVVLSADWSCNRGTIATDGTLTAPTVAGDLRVVARAGAHNASVLVTVVAGALDRLELSETNLSLATGAGAHLAVKAYDLYGNEISGLTINWSTTIGMLDPSADGYSAAFASGEHGGSGTIIVTSGGKSDNLTVDISEASISLGRQLTQPLGLAFLAAAVVLGLLLLLKLVGWRRLGGSKG